MINFQERDNYTLNAEAAKFAVKGRGDLATVLQIRATVSRVWSISDMLHVSPPIASNLSSLNSVTDRWQVYIGFRDDITVYLA